MEISCIIVIVIVPLDPWFVGTAWECRDGETVAADEITTRITMNMDSG